MKKDFFFIFFNIFRKLEMKRCDFCIVSIHHKYDFFKMDIYMQTYSKTHYNCSLFYSKNNIPQQKYSLYMYIPNGTIHFSSIFHLYQVVFDKMSIIPKFSSNK